MDHVGLCMDAPRQVDHDDDGLPGIIPHVLVCGSNHGLQYCTGALKINK